MFERFMAGRHRTLDKLSEIGRKNPVDPRVARKARKASLRRLRIKVAVIFVGCAVVVGVVSFFG